MKYSISKATSTCFLINKCSYFAYIELYFHGFRYMYFYLVKYSTCFVSPLVWLCITHHLI